MIAENIKKISQDIRECCRENNRNPNEIKLVAVSKRFPAEDIDEAVKAGHFIFGENYIQEAVTKRKKINKLAKLHFIGHLQSNKCAIAADNFTMIETIDRAKTARLLQKQLEKTDSFLDILVQINIGEDPNKSGVLPQEAEQLIKEIQKFNNLRLLGLMTITPFTHTPEDSRKYFASLKTMADDFKSLGLFDKTNKVELSMGMSRDYKIAIEEGATIIRVGTAIFGTRPDIDAKG